MRTFPGQLTAAETQELRDAGNLVMYVRAKGHTLAIPAIPARELLESIADRDGSYSITDDHD